MKALIICVIAALKGVSGLWSLSGMDLTFLVARNNRSVTVKAFIENTTSFELDPERNIKFILFSRVQEKGVQLHIGDKTTLLSSGFDLNNETKILIHGFANSASSNFIETVKSAYRESLNCNVVVVDWSALCRPPFYFSAVENAHQVGVHVGNFLDWLLSQGVNISRLHLIGHSIGAHIAGVAGHSVRQPGGLGRITGLDPAKPMFELAAEDYRLSRDDAVFVDCIHTCSGFLGMSEPHCSVDFYPNGGISPQPGCRFDFFGTCSHQRAYLYFAESLVRSTSFQAIKCSEVKNYSPSSCSEEAIEVMGQHTNISARGIFYLATSSKAPFSTRVTTAPVNIFTQFSWYFH